MSIPRLGLFAARQGHRPIPRRRHLTTASPTAPASASAPAPARSDEDDKAAERRAQSLLEQSNECQSSGDAAGAHKALLECVECSRGGRTIANAQTFAIALTSLGNYYHHMGLYHEAHQYYQEAFDFVRGRVPAQPAATRETTRDHHHHRHHRDMPLLAMCYQNLATIQCAMSDFGTGMATAKTGCALHHQYLEAIGTADARTDPPFVSALHSLAVKFGVVGDYANQAPIALECVTALSLLHLADPPMFLREVGTAMHTAATGLLGLGRVTEAASLARRALKTHKQIATNAPEVNDAHDLLSQVLLAQGKSEGALKHARSSVESRRSMLAVGGGASPNPLRQEQLVGSLFVAANAQRALGHTNDVVTSTKEAVEILLPVLDQQPGIFYPSVKHLCLASSRLHRAGGNEGLARSAATAALNAYTLLADRAPTSTAFAEGLAEARRLAS